MEIFRKAIKEIYKALDNILIFEDILDSLIIFLGVYLILMLFKIFLLSNIPVILALLPALVYLAYSLSRDSSNKLDNQKLVVVEHVYPELNEKLRTAADNVYLENPVVDELQNDVIDNLKKIRVSSFFSVKKTNYKIGATIALCLLIIIVALLNFKLMEWGIMLKERPKLLTGGHTDVITNSTTPSAGTGSSNDIFGEESVAELGNQELNIELSSLSFELTNVRKQTDIPKEDFEEKFPDEIDMLQNCDSDCMLKNNIPVDQQELVKDYFIKLAEN